MKRNGNPNTGSDDIHLRYKDGNWHRKIAMLIMRSGKREIMEGIELKNQERIRTLQTT